MTAAWPVGLRSAPLAGSYNEAADNAPAAFTPDVGPPLLRRRTSAVTSLVRYRLPLETSSAVDVLMEFWRDTLKCGTLVFTMTHPRRGGTSYFAFDGGHPPDISEHGLGYLASLNLREIP